MQHARTNGYSVILDAMDSKGVLAAARGPPLRSMKCGVGSMSGRLVAVTHPLDEGINLNVVVVHGHVTDDRESNERKEALVASAADILYQCHDRPALIIGDFDRLLEDGAVLAGAAEAVMYDLPLVMAH